MSQGAAQQTKRDPAAKEATVQEKLIEPLLLELGGAMRKSGFYPPQHPLAVKGVKRLEEFFRVLFAQQESFSVGFSREQILFNRAFLDTDKRALRQIAEHFHRANIAAIRFERGIGLIDLQKFVRLAANTDDLEALRKKGGEGYVQIPGSDHIAILFLDFRHLSIEEVRTAKRGHRRKGSDKVWKNLLGQFLSDVPSELRSVLPTRKGPQALDTEDLIQRINSGLKDVSEEERQAYENAIADQVRLLGNRVLDAPSGDHWTLRKNLAHLITNLNPSTRAQLLRLDVKKATENAAMLNSTIEDMELQTISEVIQSIDTNQKQIPKQIMTLLGTVAKLSKRDHPMGSQLDEPLRRLARANLRDSSGEELGEMLHEIFTEKSEEEINPEAYLGLFKDVENERFAPASLEAASAADHYRPQMEKEAEGARIGWIALEFLEGQLHTIQFESVLNYLTEYYGAIALEGDFELLQEIALTLYGYANADGVPAKKRDLANEFLSRYQDPRVIQDLISALDRAPRKSSNAIGDLILFGQEAAAEPLLNALEQQESRYIRKALMSLLLEIGEPCFSGIISRLSNPKWFVVRNMLVLLRELGKPEHMGHAVSALGHTDHRVRIEALRTLSQLCEDKMELVAHLQRMLDDASERVAETAVVLLSSTNDRSAFQVLCRVIRSRMIKSKRPKLVVTAIHGLAFCPSTQSVRILRNLLYKKSYFFQVKENQFKAAAVKALGDMRTEEAIKVLGNGLKSKQSFVREQCKKVLGDSRTVVGSS